MSTAVKTPDNGNPNKSIYREIKGMNEMIYELRIYHVVPGRMQDLLGRFRDHNLRLFPKYDLKITNFWVNADEAVNEFYYVLEHQDLATREKHFQAFMEDPEWVEIRKQTENDGPLYETIDEIYMRTAPFFMTPQSEES